jgi:uncharacterized protein YciI
MPLFILHSEDKPGALELRLATRPKHLEYLKAKEDKIRLGGPMLDPEGNMAGSVLVIEVEDLAAAEAFSAGDPYRQAGVFARVAIKGFQALGGSWAP